MSSQKSPAGSNVNSNPAAARLGWGSDLNHNQTVVQPVPGIPGLAFNHNQTLVRR